MKNLIDRKSFAAHRDIKRTADGFLTDGSFAVQESLCNFTRAQLDTVANINVTIASILQDTTNKVEIRATNLFYKTAVKGLRKKISNVTLRCLITKEPREEVIWLNETYFSAIRKATNQYCLQLFILDIRVLFCFDDEIVAVISIFKAGTLNEVLLREIEQGVQDVV